MRIWSDNAKATITNNPLSNVATTINLATGLGALFPNPTSPDYFIGTLTQSGDESSWEEVKVTGRSGDALTVVRGQNGTSAASWPSGSKFELRLTSDWMNAADNTQRWPVKKSSVDSGETLSIPSGYQYEIRDGFMIDGVVTLDGGLYVS